MSFTETKSSVIGSILAVALLTAVVGAKFYRGYRRAQAPQRAAAVHQQLEKDCKVHAHELMDSAPDVKRVGAYLHWAVDAFHDQAWQLALSRGPSGPAYRDALFEVILKETISTGRINETSSLEKLKTRSILAGETWWNVPPQK